MTSYCFQVRILIKGPLLSQAGESREIGIDTAARRVGDRPTLPGNLIRGNLRHAWTHFHTIKPQASPSWDPNHWLGIPSPQQTGNRPVRSRLRFDHDWVAEQPPQGRGTRHRIRIDPKTGAVATGMMQVIDSPFNTGEDIAFIGRIEAELDNEAEANAMAVHIRKGLEYASSLGAMKTAGYGRIGSVGVRVQPLTTGQEGQEFEAVATREAGLPPVTAGVLAGQPLSPSLSRYGLILKFDRPICVARPHAGNNRYEAENHIPGGVIRGAMAALIFQGDRSDLCADPRFAALCRHFKHLRITQALPVLTPQDGATLKRPIIPPLSLVEAPAGRDSPDSRLYDVALLPQAAGLIHGRAPAFCMDWKSGGAGYRTTADWCGGNSPNRRIEVRTAIDKESGAAQDSALFATEAVLSDKHLWLAEIDLAAIPETDRRAVIAALQDLLRQPLRQIGKTKANASARLHPPFEPHIHSRPEILHGGIACVCLQSPARLLPDAYDLKGTGGEDALKRLEDALNKRYERTWQDLSGGHLQLERYFARQELVGGRYLQERFWSSRGAYNPELLTAAGSIFVLRAIGDEAIATATLTAWRDHGLGQPPDAIGGEDWRVNPYIRPNGYGEVAINLELHWLLQPSEEAWHGLD